jgi:hypothetical protein
MMRIQQTSRRLALPIAGLLALAACTTPTPYQPYISGTTAPGGYSEQRIEDNRFRVAFAGNSVTARETVETYLLYRAAELTVQNGFDGFTMVHRDLDPNTEIRVHDYGFGGPWGYGWWGPSWRYHYGGYWRHWHPWGGPFWANDIDVYQVRRWEAIAEILMFKGQRPGDPTSFNARDVIENLRPRLVFPEAR